MSQTDIEMGRVVVILGIAPIRPQEFINVRITCQTQASSVSSRPWRKWRPTWRRVT